MRVKNKDWLLALGVLAIGALLHIGQNGIYPRHFDIDWSEEVQLHDGRVILVNIKRTFERQSGFDRWRGINRDTEISFDAGGTLGKVEWRFQRYDISFLHNKGNDWYVALGVTTGTPPIKLVTPERAVLVIAADGRQSQVSKDELPSEFISFNVMPLTPSPSGVAKFDGQVLTITEKTAHWQANPRAAGDGPNMRILSAKRSVQ